MKTYFTDNNGILFFQQGAKKSPIDNKNSTKIVETII
jgi:hypothetical protein